METQASSLLSKNPSRIRLRETLGSGRWLQLERLTWTQKNGEPHHWEAVARQGKGSVVMVIATLQPSGRLVLVRQYRPALDKVCVEFPAGLVDAEESFEVAALRELREETGYVGVVRGEISPRVVSSGLSSESIAIVIVDVDENLEINHHPQAELEDSEDLETFLLAREQWKTLLQASSEMAIDAKLTAFLLAACWNDLFRES